MTVELNAPIDRPHDESRIEREVVRRWLADARRRVALWEPREMPR